VVLPVVTMKIRLKAALDVWDMFFPRLSTYDPLPMVAPEKNVVLQELKYIE